jgi:DNA-binding transcriptional ArsR family regulator
MTARVVAVQSALQAVANPLRLEILRLVWDSERSSREIAEHFEVTWQAVSHNLRVLREAGLLTERRNGTRRLYRAAREELGPLETFLADMWAEDLGRLNKAITRDVSKDESR